MTKTIVVVGASRGIGRATALALAQPDVNLVLAARSSDALKEVAAHVCAAGATASVVPCDATQEIEVEQLIATAAHATGQIDVLVHSVGGATVAPFETLSLEQWEQSVRVLLTSTFLVCKHAIAVMQAGSLIVNVASVAARQPFPNWSAYAAAKHGVLGFANTIREELRPRGIRVTTVLPAAIDTALWDAIPGTWNRANMLRPSDVAEAIAALVAQPVHVTVEDLVIGHTVGRL